MWVSFKARLEDSFDMRCLLEAERLFVKRAVELVVASLCDKRVIWFDKEYS